MLWARNASAAGPGISGEADRCGILEVASPTRTTPRLSWGVAWRGLAGNDRRRVTDADVVDVTGELEGHSDRRAMGQLGYGSFGGASIDGGRGTHHIAKIDVTRGVVDPEIHVGWRGG